MEMRDKKESLHCNHRLEALRNGVNKEISNLVGVLLSVTEQSFLEMLPKIRSQTIYNARVIAEQISNETKENEYYNTTITYHKYLVKEL
jgi:transcription antitermination factor NusA-like protein